MFEYEMATWHAAEKVLQRSGRPTGDAFHHEVSLLAAKYVRVDDLFASVSPERAVNMALDQLDRLRRGPLRAPTTPPPVRNVS